MDPGRFTLRISKERFKFSSAHFTLLPRQPAERLHGHNYQVELEATLTRLDPGFEMGPSFLDLKEALGKTISPWDEKILLPSDQPAFNLSIDKSVRLTFSDRTYEFPKDEVVFLPCKNISTESLVRLAHAGVQEELRSGGILGGLTGLAITISETIGQSVRFATSLKGDEKWN